MMNVIIFFSVLRINYDSLLCWNYFYICLHYNRCSFYLGIFRLTISALVGEVQQITQGPASISPCIF